MLVNPKLRLVGSTTNKLPISDYTISRNEDTAVEIETAIFNILALDIADLAGTTQIRGNLPPLASPRCRGV